MVKRCWAEIDLDLIDHNVAEIRKLMGPTKIMGIVKAEAYGHGAVECARRLVENGIDFLAVAELDEAIDLRKAGIDVPILILGYTPPEGFENLLKYDLIQTVVSLDYARQLDAFGPVRVHVKIDTGMNRSGITYRDRPEDKEILKKLYALKNLRFEGIYSHFAVSDELDEESLAFTAAQEQFFKMALEYLRENGIHYGISHLQNSYGILNYGDSGFDYCRPGLLYMGVSSNDQIKTRHEIDLKPILSLKARIGMVKKLKKGETISYGRNYTADHDMEMATVTIGYADGLSRLCSNQGMEVLVNGQRCRILGNICMDQCMIDVTGVDAKPGDEVVIIGQSGDEIVDVDTISRLSHTINNETLSRLGPRIKRVYKGKERTI